jgi:release factor glutamine methyltransferase
MIFNEIGYGMGNWTLSRLKSSDSKPPASFTLLDMDWCLFAEVWPGNAPATTYFTSWLPYEEADRFLEVGCGTGATSVIAALRGCPQVVALDINPAAVENTRTNAARYRVNDQITVLHSNLFAELGMSEEFDLIYWNSPFIEAPADRAYRSDIERAIFDPGYGLHQAFFETVGRYLASDGRVFLGFSDTLGNSSRLEQIATQAGFNGSIYRRQVTDFPTKGLRNVPTIEAHFGEGGKMRLDFTRYEFKPA